MVQTNKFPGYITDVSAKQNEWRRVTRNMHWHSKNPKREGLTRYLLARQNLERKFRNSESRRFCYSWLFIISRRQLFHVITCNTIFSVCKIPTNVLHFKTKSPLRATINSSTAVPSKVEGSVWSVSREEGSAFKVLRSRMAFQETMRKSHSKSTSNASPGRSSRVAGRKCLLSGNMHERVMFAFAWRSSSAAGIFGNKGNSTCKCYHFCKCIQTDLIRRAYI